MFRTRERFLPNFSILFAVSLALMGAHVIDDAFVGEAGWWGVSVGEFLVFNILLYLTAPPIGLVLARRGYAGQHAQRNGGISWRYSPSGAFSPVTTSKYTHNSSL